MSRSNRLSADELEALWKIIENCFDLLIRDEALFAFPA